MMDKFNEMKNQLSELAAFLNAFKSEAVQLRILDLVLGGQPRGQMPCPQGSDKTLGTRRERRTQETNMEAAVGGDKKRKAPTGTGPGATLTQLLSGNFFDKPRTINDIIDHSKDKLARAFKANELSGKLAGMVRRGELTRNKNADNQYEYKKP